MNLIAQTIADGLVLGGIYALAAADYETFYARIKFTPDGDGDPLTLGSMIGQVQKGKLETVFPEKARSANPIYPAPTWDKKA